MSKKKFDFDHLDFKNASKHRRQFYIENHDKPVTEDEFIKTVASWPKKHNKNSLTRSASSARNQYRRLVKVFGFFPGGQ